MPKNYYLYFHDGKVKRQSINLNDIYPESYALDKIPDDADVFAKIITSDTNNKTGYRAKHLVSTWLKHTIWTDYYANDLFVEFKDAVLFHEAQIRYIEKYIPLLKPEEAELLKESTRKTYLRVFQNE